MKLYTTSREREPWTAFEWALFAYVMANIVVALEFPEFVRGQV